MLMVIFLKKYHIYEFKKKSDANYLYHKYANNYVQILCILGYTKMTNL
jgi:hypothetical protein